MRRLAACALILSTLISGCAIIFKGTTDKISIETDPAGAQVTVNGEVKGVSPISFEVPSNQGLGIQVSKAGYESQYVTNSPVSRSGLELLSLLGGIIPLIIDRAYGADMGHKDTTMYVRLEPLPAPATNSNSSSPSGTSATIPIFQPLF